MKFYAFSIGLVLLTFQLHAQDWNLDFEQWNDSITTPNLVDTVVADRVGIYPSNWFSNPGFIPEGKGIGQTTDGIDEGYAVVLSGFYQFETMRITTGTSPGNTGWPIDYSPTDLKGSYKAILMCSTCDSLRAYVDVYATTYDTIRNHRDTIAQGHLILIETKNEYVDFKLPLSYAEDSQVEPDSITIVIAKRRFGFGSQAECWECSHVFFDNFSLPVLPEAVIDDKNAEADFICYPNPTTNKLTISNLSNSTKRFQVIDLQGRIHFEGSMEKSSEFTIDTQCIEGGMLLITDGISTKKIIVTK